MLFSRLIIGSDVEELILGIDPSVFSTQQLKRHLLAVVVQLELRRIERHATRAEVSEGCPADALHPSLADLDPERLALGGGARSSVVPQ